MSVTSVAANRESGIGNRESAIAVRPLFLLSIPHSPFPASQGAAA